MLWPANSSWGLNVLFEHTTHTEMNWSWKLLLHHCIKCLWITHPKSSPACSLLFSLCYILLTANCAARKKKNYKFALNLPNESYTDNAVTSWNWVGHTSFPIFFLHPTLLVCHRVPAFFPFPIRSESLTIYSVCTEATWSFQHSFFLLSVFSQF